MKSKMLSIICCFSSLFFSGCITGKSTQDRAEYWKNYRHADGTQCPEAESNYRYWKQNAELLAPTNN